MEGLTPRAAVIQVGEDNRYGHPAPETLSVLDAVGVDFYSTDVCGDIVVQTKGDNFSVEHLAVKILKRLPLKKVKVK